MTWITNPGLALSSLMATIESNLTANGWTLTDRSADGVFDAVNNQGVHQYVQITNCQSGGTAADSTHNMYLQLQAWLSWNTGTHAGASGSGTTYNRIYYAASNVADTTTVDLYMSVTANRFIIYIQGVGNYRHWGYFGGLDSLAGTNDPFSALLITSHGPISTSAWGAFLLPSSGGASYWPAAFFYYLALASLSALGILAANVVSQQQLGSDASQMMLFPILVGDSAAPNFRGNLDGIVCCPLGNGALAHLDTVSQGSTTYMVVQPGGIPVNGIPLTGSYNLGLALAEV